MAASRDNGLLEKHNLLHKNIELQAAGIEESHQRRSVRSKSGQKNDGERPTEPRQNAQVAHAAISRTQLGKNSPQGSVKLQIERKSKAPGRDDNSCQTHVTPLRPADRQEKDSYGLQPTRR
jgi:hypothetical protein